jgi:molybdopterin/thiamine biosynthesis adenylyltransferase
MEEMANQIWTTPYIATNITETKQQRALLLHYAGPAVDEIFDTSPDTGVDKDYKTAVDVFNA